jgi:hypothetical protein
VLNRPRGAEIATVPVHVDLDFSHTTFTDTAGKYVAARTGALVLTHRASRFLFSGIVGEKVSYVVLPRVGGPTIPKDDAGHSTGFTWSLGVRYDIGTFATLHFATGQDLGNTLIPGGADYQHFVRIDAQVHVL